MKNFSVTVHVDEPKFKEMIGPIHSELIGAVRKVGSYELRPRFVPGFSDFPSTAYIYDVQTKMDLRNLIEYIKFSGVHTIISWGPGSRG